MPSNSKCQMLSTEKGRSLQPVCCPSLHHICTIHHQQTFQSLIESMYCRKFHLLHLPPPTISLLTDGVYLKLTPPLSM